MRLPSVALVVCAVLFGAVLPAASDNAFPFGSELMLEASPMPGSKRVPLLEIDDDGTATIDLWCVSLRGEAKVGADSTITITPGDPQPATCSPERQASDAELLTALSQVTNWRRQGDLVELTGATTLRFRLMTN